MGKEKALLRQQQILDLAKAEKRDLNDDEQKEFDVLQLAIDAEPGEERERSSADETTRAAVESERARIQGITDLCREFDMDAAQFINDGRTVDYVRDAVIEKMRKEKEPVGARAQITEAAEDKFRAAASDSLLMRAGLTVEKPAEGARQFMGLRLRDLAIECLGQEGASGLQRKSDDELYSMLQRGFFNPEAAFPAILDQTIEKAYVEGHKNAPVTFDRWTKKGSLSDFKTHDNNYIAGPVGEFYEVPENGELKHDVFSDDKLPTRKLRTYGRQFTLSRKAFIDDDIGLVTSLPARHAAAARKTINKQCIQILINNPAIYDGVELFSGDHANLLAEGTGITQDAVQTMIMALSTQTDQFGEPIIVNPGQLLVPSGMAFDIYTLFNSPYIETSDNTQAVNPLYNYRTQIEVIEDPTINVLCGGLGNVMPWFLIANQNDSDFIEVDYLNGQEIPNIRRMETPGQLGFVWDIYLDWGISVMDFRGAVKNPGTTVSTTLELAAASTSESTSES